MTWQTKTDPLAPLGGVGALSRLSGLPEWLRSNLFRQSSGGRLTWRRVLAGVLFAIAAAAASLARTSGPGALNSTWIEDAGNFLQDALNQPVLTTLTTQINGYYEVVPRVISAIAVTFPVAWAPGIMSAAAAAEYALFGLIVYIASGPHLRSPWLRLLVAVPACVVPLGYTQVNNDLATVQFIALYGIFWLLLWRPVTRAGQICAPVIMLGATLTSILPAFFAPLVAARLIADRSKTAIAVAVCWAAGLLAQWTDQLRGTSNRSNDLFTSPLWILGNYVTRAVPRAIFGERALGGPGTNYKGSPIPLSIPDMAVHEALIWGACAIVVAVVVIALGRLTAPHWPLAVIALAFSVVLFVGEIVDNEPVVQPRYVIAPALLLYTAVVAMLRPRGVTDDAPSAGENAGVPSGDEPATAASAGASLRSVVVAWTPVTVLALLLAVVVGFNFRVVNTRSESPPWTAVVAAARHTCMKPGVAGYEYSHLWWHVQIPCSKV
jgi:energy-converting hydrogenase Eha subunit E